MRVAVTGITGFIGRAVAAQLAAAGATVVGVVHLPQEAQSPVLPPGTATVVADLAQPQPDLYARLGQPDMVLHLAWPSVAHTQALSHLEATLPQHYALLKGLLDSGLPRLVVAGTCFEYGLQSGALHEDLPAQPVTAYGLAKHTLRQMLEFYLADRARQVPTAPPAPLLWLRFFYLHGPGQQAKSLLPQLDAALARGDAEFPMSGGEQLRDYLPVDTAAQYAAALALKPQATGVVNVCHGQPTSVRRLVEEHLQALGKTGAIRLKLGHYPYSPVEPMAFWGDNRRMRALLEA